MTAAIALDTSPIKVVHALRGSIVDAHEAHPQALHLEIRDSEGGLWRLATQDADYSPSESKQLAGGTVERSEIDEGHEQTPTDTLRQVVPCELFATGV